MSILMLVASFTKVNVNILTNAINYLDYKICSNCIIDFINNGKQYCKEHSDIGSIIVFNSNGEHKISLRSQGKNIYQYKLPKGFKFSQLRNKKINIDSSGSIKNAGSLRYLDRKGKEHLLTICVGTGHVQEKY